MDELKFPSHDFAMFATEWKMHRTFIFILFFNMIFQQDISYPLFRIIKKTIKWVFIHSDMNLNVWIFLHCMNENAEKHPELMELLWTEANSTFDAKIVSQMKCIRRVNLSVLICCSLKTIKQTLFTVLFFAVRFHF